MNKLAEDKIIEIFCIVDDFCKEYSYAGCYKYLTSSRSILCNIKCFLIHHSG
jgi:hypothetical protein